MDRRGIAAESDENEDRRRDEKPRLALEGPKRPQRRAGARRAAARFGNVANHGLIILNGIAGNAEALEPALDLGAIGAGVGIDLRARLLEQNRLREPGAARFDFGEILPFRIEPAAADIELLGRLARHDVRIADGMRRLPRQFREKPRQAFHKPPPRAIRWASRKGRRHRSSRSKPDSGKPRRRGLPKPRSRLRSPPSACRAQSSCRPPARPKDRSSEAPRSRDEPPIPPKAAAKAQAPAHPRHAAGRRQRSSPFWPRLCPALAPHSRAQATAKGPKQKSSAGLKTPFRAPAGKQDLAQQGRRERLGSRASGGIAHFEIADIAVRFETIHMRGTFHTFERAGGVELAIRL